ncbi:MAG: restriction endonuclease [Myxococcota bacterium]
MVSDYDGWKAEEASPGYVLSHSYVVDQIYRDSTDPKTNQFSRWLEVKNSGGIRPRTGNDGTLVALVLVSTHVAVATYNPWEDIVEPLQGRVWYWGDAKAHASKRRDDWQGNRYLAQIWEDINEGRWSKVPPILHFSKPAKGLVRFTGLCVLTDLRDAWMEDKGMRVRNYNATLDILPVDKVPVAWIRARKHGVDMKVPPEWAAYATTGKHERLLAYAKQVRSQQEQLPEAASSQRALLHDLNQLDPFKFERLVVRAFQSMEVSHDISQTRRSRDGGFDFLGSFQLPPPLSYRIAMKGEVKRYDPERHGVGPRDVARLVARLQRGEHGVFATNSYFTRQAQAEVLEDRYPVELIHGGRLAGMLAKVGAVKGGKLDDSWVRGE